VDDGVDFDGDVVAGDRFLSGDLECDDAQVNLAHALDAGDEEEQARSTCPDQAAKAEDDAALVLLDDLDRRAQQHEPEYHDDGNDDEDGGHMWNAPSRACARNKTKPAKP